MNASAGFAISVAFLAAVMVACQESPTAGPDPGQLSNAVTVNRDGVMTGAPAVAMSVTPQSMAVAAANDGVVVPSALATVMGNSNNVYPHSMPNMRYQQVIPGAEIGRPMTIRELCIRPDDQYSSPALVQQLTVKLGPTNLDPSTIGAAFDANYAAAPTTVFSGDFSMPATGPGGINDWKGCIEFTAAYRYDGGNLLIEILNTSPFQLQRWAADFCYSCSTARLFAYSAGSPVAQFVDRNVGLVLRLSSGSVIPVEVDVKPGSDENPINPRSGGLVPVAILGTTDLNVREIDATTLRLGPSGARPVHDWADPATGAGHFEDVNLDGSEDLVTHYRQGETGLTGGDTVVCIDGTTTDGTPIHGCDVVRVLGG